MVREQLLPTLIAALVLENRASPQTASGRAAPDEADLIDLIERAVSRGCGVKLGQSLSGGDAMLRAFAFEQSRLLERAHDLGGAPPPLQVSPPPPEPVPAGEAPLLSARRGVELGIPCMACGAEAGHRCVPADASFAIVSGSHVVRIQEAVGAAAAEARE